MTGFMESTARSGMPEAQETSWSISRHGSRQGGAEPQREQMLDQGEALETQDSSLAGQLPCLRARRQPGILKWSHVCYSLAAGSVSLTDSSFFDFHQICWFLPSVEGPRMPWKIDFSPPFFSCLYGEVMSTEFFKGLMTQSRH